MKNVKIAFLVPLLLMFLLLAGRTGCMASDDIEIHDTDTSFSQEGERAYDELKERTYNETLDKIQELVRGDSNDVIDKDYVKQMWIYVFYVYDVINGMFAFLLILCESLGLIIALFSTKNKKRRKFALIGMCVTIPLVLILIEFGIPTLYVKFRA